MNIGDEISKLAEAYDPDRDADAQAVRAIMQGAMYMATSLKKITPALSEIIKIREVEQLRDEHGDYLPYYTVITESGIRIRVTLEVE